MEIKEILARLSPIELTELKELIKLKEEGRVCTCGEVIPKERLELGLQTCKKCATPTQILRVREGIGGGNSKFHTELVSIP